MADYSSLKVAELKDVLKAKGLSVSGTKPELLARLKEADEAEAPGEVSVEVPEQDNEELPIEKEAVEPVVDKKVEEENNKPVATETVAESSPVEVVPEAAVAKAPSGPTAEELIEELERRIKRNERFGNEDKNEELQQQITRLRKFGVPENVSKALQPKVDTAKISKKKNTKNTNKSTDTPKIVIDEETLKRRQAKFGTA